MRDLNLLQEIESLMKLIEHINGGERPCQEAAHLIQARLSTAATENDAGSLQACRLLIDDCLANCCGFAAVFFAGPAALAELIASGHADAQAALIIALSRWAKDHSHEPAISEAELAVMKRCDVALADTEVHAQQQGPAVATEMRLACPMDGCSADFETEGAVNYHIEVVHMAASSESGNAEKGNSDDCRDRRLPERYMPGVGDGRSDQQRLRDEAGSLPRLRPRRQERGNGPSTSCRDRSTSLQTWSTSAGDRFPTPHAQPTSGRDPAALGRRQADRLSTAASRSTSGQNGSTSPQQVYKHIHSHVCRRVRACTQLVCPCAFVYDM